MKFLDLRCINFGFGYDKFASNSSLKVHCLGVWLKQIGSFIENMRRGWEDFDKFKEYLMDIF